MYGVPRLTSLQTFALKSHVLAVHQGLRYPCPRDDCSKAFAHRSSLRKHLAGHDMPTTPRKVKAAQSAGDHDIRAMFAGVKAPSLRYGCPAHHVPVGGEDVPKQCLERYNRVYDVRRHLKSEHGLVLEDMEVRLLLAKES